MTTRDDLIYGDCFFKAVDGTPPTVGHVVKLSSGEIADTTSVDDAAWLGIVQDNYLETDATYQTSVKDCLGNEYTHSVVKRVQQVKRSGVSDAKLDDAGGAISAGDLLTTSAKAGFLEKQAAAGVQSYTVAQAIEDAVFDGNGEQLDAKVLLKG